MAKKGIGYITFVNNGQFSAGTDDEAILSDAVAYPDSAIRMPLAVDGKLEDFCCRVVTNSLNNTLTVTVLKNGVATPIVFTWAAGETGFKFINGSVPVIRGDAVSFHVVADLNEGNFQWSAGMRYVE